MAAASESSEAGAQGALLRVRRDASRAWPEEGALTKMWEADTDVRSCFRCHKSHLLIWPSSQLVGAASLKALAMNVPVIKLALEIWGGHTTEEKCKAMPIDWLKQEALNVYDGAS